jgi:hypothetical protein
MIEANSTKNPSKRKSEPKSGVSTKKKIMIEKAESSKQAIQKPKQLMQ